MIRPIHRAGEPAPVAEVPAAPFDKDVYVASYEGYCVKCKEKRQFDGQEVTLANGRPAAQGTCPVCGTKMNRMLSGKK